MSLGSTLAKLFVSILPIVAPGWSTDLNTDITRVEAYIVKTYGPQLSAYCQSLVPMAIAGVEKQAKVAEQVITLAAQDSIKVTEDIARLIAQRSYLQIVPTIKADAKAAWADVKKLI